MEHIINEYFAITGRPISTMTVDEYLKFCEYGRSDIVNTTITGTDKEVISNPPAKKDKSAREDAKDIPEPVKSEQKPQSIATDTVKDDKMDKSGILAMLKSVSG